MMGCMPPNCFSNVKNGIVKSKHDTEGGIWLPTMWHIPWKKGWNHLQNHLGQNNLIKVRTPWTNEN